MPTPFSIVVICKNEVRALAESLPILISISSDVIIYDTGSTDGTQALVKEIGGRLIEGTWEGFGPTKNKANALANNEWILSLDADEFPDARLKAALLRWAPPAHEKTAYTLSFINYFGQQAIRFGEWGRDKHLRFFNRKFVHWNEALVHEKLLLPSDTLIKSLKGNVIHRTVQNFKELKDKTWKYAKLSAEKYFQQEKKATWIKLYLSPPYTFFHYYILKLGFLDGRAGLLCAYMTARYTYLKYHMLKALW